MGAPFVGGTDQQDDVAFGGKADAGHVVIVGDEADAGNGRGRQDADAIGLVVERDIAGNDGEFEEAAGLADAFESADELAHGLRLFRIAEIEVVGHGQRLGAGGGQVAPAFRDGLFAAFKRIGVAIARVDVGGEGEGFGRVAVDADDAGIAARQLQGVALDPGVILLVDPAARGQVRRADKAQQRLGNVDRRDRRLDRLGLFRLDPGPVIFGGLVAELLDRQVADLGALPDQAEAQIVGGDADGGEIEFPFSKTARASASFSGLSTISMRSWDSESIIS